MDLPTCPACKQSVLDDEAAECPFCGASLKGGAPAPRAGTATAPAKAAPPRGAPPRGAPPRSTGGSKPETTRTSSAAAAPTRETAKPEEKVDDDPFAVDPGLAAKATPVSPRPGPGKSLEVKCPMCETPGFVSPKAAGTQVKCCNPQCLVPIFTAPAPKKVEAPPPPPPKKKNPAVLYGAIIGAVVIVGGVVIWQMTEPPARQGTRSSPPPLPIGADFPTPNGTLPGEGGDATGAETADPDATKAAQVAVDPRIELTRLALKKVVDSAFSAPPIRKANCRRMAATAYIASGDLTEGRAQLDQLLLRGTNTPYEGCLPVVLLAWAEIGKPEAFAKNVAEAEKLAGKLPSRGRYSVEAGIATAAILAAAGRINDAQKMLADHQGPPDLKQFSAALQVVLHDGTFDLDAPLVGRSVGEWQAPQETAVALILSAHNRWDDAQAWAAALSDPAARSEATLAWAEAYARAALADSPGADMARSLSAADSLPPAVKARLLARLAGVHLAAGNRETSEELLQQADGLVQGLALPAPVKIQGIKPLQDWKAPDALPLRQAALASADIGIVRYQLQQAELAWSSFERSLKFLRGTAPALNFIAPRRAQLEGAGADAVRAELKTALQLRTDDQMRRAVLQYRQKVDDILKAATNRFLWQAEVLEAAASLGLADQVWNEAELSQRRPIADEREPFLASDIPLQVAGWYQAAGKAARHDEVLSAAADHLESAVPEMVIRIHRAQSQSAVNSQDAASAVNVVNEILSETGTLHEWSSRLACRLVKAGHVPQAVGFLGSLKDTGLKEDGLTLASALAARTGHAAAAWSVISTKLNLSESAAGSAGLVLGLSRSQQAGAKAP